MQDFLHQIYTLKVWKKGDRRAAHKPLLLLMTRSRAQRGTDRLTSYENTAEALLPLQNTFL